MSVEQVEIRTRLQRERERRRWTQAALSYRARVTASAISRIEARLALPAGPEKMRLAEALGMDAEALFADWPQRIPLGDPPLAETAE